MTSAWCPQSVGVSLAMRVLLASSLLVATAGCRHTFPLPYTVAQLEADSSRWPGEALVHYLGQDNASVEVCDLGGASSLRKQDDSLVEPFVEALGKDTLRPDRWQACATQLTPSLPSPVREVLFQKLSRLVLSLLSGSSAANDENDPAASKLIAAHEVLVVRPREGSAALDALTTALFDFPRAKLGAAIPPIYDALLTTLELDHGRLGGRPLTALDIDNAQDEALLLRMANRLPEEAQRKSAKHRVVRLRIERSDWPEVKARAAEVEATVVAQGRWAQRVGTLTLERPEPPVPTGFVGEVTQDIEAQSATLVAAGHEVAPAIDLKPLLHFPVGFSRPLGLCASASELVVEPCIDARDVELANPAVRLDARGALHLPEQLSMQAAFELARGEEGLVVPVRLAGRLVTSIQVPVHFVLPATYLFTSGHGAHGMAINMVVTSTAENLLFDAVAENQQRKQAIYPRGGGVFWFGSQGGSGWSGANGKAGIDGVNGRDGQGARCPGTAGSSGLNGTNGGRGGDGGRGGPGGDGGPVFVELRCSVNCTADEHVVRSIVRSEAGLGGNGGKGGAGGKAGTGGRGGGGTTCTANGQQYSLPGGSNGVSGAAGQQGREGDPGVAGREGHVNVVVRRP
jgi:hypothetical protein